MVDVHGLGEHSVQIYKGQPTQEVETKISPEMISSCHANQEVYAQGVTRKMGATSSQAHSDTSGVLESFNGNPSRVVQSVQKTEY